MCNIEYKTIISKIPSVKPIITHFGEEIRLHLCAWKQVCKYVQGPPKFFDGFESQFHLFL